MTIASRLDSRRSPSAAAAAPLEGRIMPGQKTVPRYLDVGANVLANVGLIETKTKTYSESCSWLDVTCSDAENSWGVPMTCPNNHRWVKTIVCGKEWCPICGKKGSAAHNRRYVRWLNKIRQFRSMCYFVFTIPMNTRYKYRDKESLKKLGRSCQIIMIKHGFKRGLRRYHWFGDRSHVYNPHINILVEGAFIQEELLNDIKKEWRDLLGVRTASIHVNYKSTPEDMLGSLFYVTRPTFGDYNWDIDMAMELRNFRNMVVWGRDWKQETKWEMPVKERTDDNGKVLDVYTIEKLLEHECAICHEKVKALEPLPTRLLELNEMIDIGAGYRYVIERNQPGGLDESVKDRLATMRLVKHAKSLGAVEVVQDKPVKKGYWRYNPDLPKGRELFYPENPEKSSE